LNLNDFRSRLGESRLIASVQASPSSSLDLDALDLAAETSLRCGAAGLRAEGAEAVARFLKRTELVIGLIKRKVDGWEPYITPTRTEVDLLIGLGCPIIALDGTARPRPGGERLADLIAAVQRAGRLAMADCDTIESIRQARAAGADLVGTTLSGYTRESRTQAGPDLELVRTAAAEGSAVIAEGRYSDPAIAQAALAAGAEAVVIGGALNDPAKQTLRFADALRPAEGPVGAVDIGGTWIRFGLFDPETGLSELERSPLPRARTERLAWIEERMNRHGLPPDRIGIGTGGVVDPQRAEITRAKSLIPDYAGSRFAWPEGQAKALNDGLATAWGHAQLPRFAGRRIAVLALGTGVGFGVVSEQRLWIGEGGEPPHLNDTRFDRSRTIEDVLGGLALSEGRDPGARAEALEAACSAIDAARKLFHPDEVVVCGGVGLCDWMADALAREGAAASPYGADAGLVGAAWIALRPPGFHR
jgi:N-acetylmannosamine-6-phosphate 2-epimerase/N-acetylmannosamine kinase